MSGKMTKQDAAEFKSYLRQCTDKQVQGVYDKEKAAGRTPYVTLAISEAMSRGIKLEF